MVRLDVTALYTEINRLESLVSEQAREIARLVEAGQAIVEALAALDGVEGGDLCDRWDRIDETVAEWRAALAARGGED